MQASFDQQLNDVRFWEDLTALSSEAPQVAIDLTSGSSHSPSDGGSSNTAITKKKVALPCPGCARIFNMHFEFATIAENAKWAIANGAGSYCGGCQTIWRTSFRATRSLTLMTPWLSNTVNSDEFALHQYAYYMLKLETHKI